jgi:hypothetical protein
MREHSLCIGKLMPMVAAGAFLGSVGAASADPTAVPPYAHIFVLIEENHTADEIIGNPSLPVINRLAKEYGYASQFYAERHPSEPNYVAMVGGNTFGIADDDAFYCKPRLAAYGCAKSGSAGYVDHTVSARSLADQILARGLRWKGYFEDLPAPGSLDWRWPSPQSPAPGKPEALYASKHNGFISFKSVQGDPARAERIVGFDVLYHDLAQDTVPAYAQIVPNQCNDMHGLDGDNVPADCAKSNKHGLMSRGDATVGTITDKIMQSAAWKGAGNTAIVITFDENDDKRDDGHPAGCCGSAQGDADNPGGGWIPTIVITNHGPRGVVDATPYNHYSLLRTTEDALGIAEHLGHAADSAKGVTVMAPLFAVKPL